MRASVVIGGLAAVLAVAGAFVILSGGEDRPEESAEQDGARGPRARDGERRGDRRRGGEARSGGRGDRDGGGADLEQRVAKLEREVATLRRQLALSTGRRVASAGSDETELTDELENPVFDNAVRDIVADERQREREERWQRFSERALAQLSEATGLDAERQTAIAALWDTERDKLTPLIQSARSGEVDFAEVREQVDKIREESDAEARKILDDTEYEAYLESRPRGPGRRGRDRGGDRGGGGGGRGN